MFTCGSLQPTDAQGIIIINNIIIIAIIYADLELLHCLSLSSIYKT